ncbi:multidrug resistance efflux transporter family protein [Schinkia azotoformans]|nr:multidrug resistance efflux transporter family protein [Schinkia azotoformans]MEC1637248.1 multidrug resistance efflux transporter family protein [Schinkia azotoformans]MEC1943652.1 multidrug resistance efflux transporter family protein [Schinkia azotoformans]
MKAILIGIIASFFFASTFILNRSMDLSGGSWIWSASLRYIFMIPFLLLIVGIRGNMKPMFEEMKKKPFEWLLWSTIGFGLFYTPITYAAAFGPGWLVAGTWQTTIIAGSLLVPFLQKEKIPVKELKFSSLILIGVIIIQAQQATQVELSSTLLSILPVIIAAFAYPLGNRKMMEVCDGRLDTFQRVLGMTIASLPFWFVLSTIGLFIHGAPSNNQLFQSFIVAIFSGLIATVLFFYATDLARKSSRLLAAVEATQSGEIIFAIIGEMLLLGAAVPGAIALVGLGLIVLGMILHSLSSQKIQINSD